jgi:hypothetical protein
MRNIKKLKMKIEIKNDENEIILENENSSFYDEILAEKVIILI